MVLRGTLATILASPLVYRSRFLGQIRPAILKRPVARQGVVLPEPESLNRRLEAETRGLTTWNTWEIEGSGTGPGFSIGGLDSVTLAVLGHNNHRISLFLQGRGQNSVPAGFIFATT